MKENKLTKNIIKQISEYGISEKDILSVCPADLSFEGEYILGYVFLTDKYIGVCKSDIPTGYTHFFRGTKVHKKVEEEDLAEYEVTLFDLAKTEHLRIERMIGAVLLSAEYDGSPIKIASMTNTYLEQINLFVRHTKNIKNGKAFDADIVGKEAE